MTDTSSHPVEAAHAVMAAAVRAADPLPAAHAAIVSILNKHVRIDANGTTTVLEADGSPMLDGAAGYANATVETLMRKLRSDRPELFEPAPSTKPADTAKLDTKRATLTELFSMARAGDAAARAEIERRARHGDGTPSPREAPPAINYSETMRKARAGDAGAIAALEAITWSNLCT